MIVYDTEICDYRFDYLKTKYSTEEHITIMCKEGWSYIEGYMAPSAEICDDCEIDSKLYSLDEAIDIYLINKLLMRAWISLYGE